MEWWQYLSDEKLGVLIGKAVADYSFVAAAIVGLLTYIGKKTHNKYLLWIAKKAEDTLKVG